VLAGPNNRATGNTIAYNTGDGITVGGAPSAVNNYLAANSIYSNGGLGIDLDDDGVTLNDPGDTDNGSNEGQNFPDISAAQSDGLISGSIQSTADTVMQVEFYLSPVCNASTYGEGKTLLGTSSMSTGPTGTSPFSVNFGALPVGAAVTGTMRDPTGNTSEFSACVSVTGPEPAGQEPDAMRLRASAASASAGLALPRSFR
jgi:hypothetical protein